MYMLHRLRGLGLSARVFEAGNGVGGTWYWNRYPGARCDVESMEYSYSFSHELQQEWQWTERYATQPEILRYLNHVADRFDLRRDIQFDTRVTAARFDEATGRWTVETDARRPRHARAICVMATGCLSAAQVPDFPGLESFEGRLYHTGRWPHEGVDFTGKRVGVIGTGSSAIQSIPMIAEQAAHLTSSSARRTSASRAQRPARPGVRAASQGGLRRASGARRREIAAAAIDDPSRASRRSRSPAGGARARATRRAGSRAASVPRRLQRPAARQARPTTPRAEFVRAKIRERRHGSRASPSCCARRDHPIGTKRLCVDTDYYETFNRDNVTLVDVRDDADRGDHARPACAPPTAEYELDVIVFATGFDAMTGALLEIDIRGRDGATLRDAVGRRPAHLPRPDRRRASRTCS